MSFTSKWESDHIWFLCKPGTPSTKICGKHMETSFLPSWKHLSASFLGAGIFYPYLEFQGVPKDFCWGPSMTRWTSQHPTHKWPVAASPIYHQEITELGHLSPVISGHVKNHGPFSSFRIRFFFFQVVICQQTVELKMRAKGENPGTWSMNLGFSMAMFAILATRFQYVSIWDLTPDRGNIPEMRLVVLNCFEVFFPNH